MSESIRLSMPDATAGRVTNVGPVPDKVLTRISARCEEDDEEGVRRFMKAQAFGGED